MSTKSPFDEHTEPAFDESDEQPTERLQLDVLTAFVNASQQARLAEQLEAAEEAGEGAEPTIASTRRRSGSALSDVFRTVDATRATLATTSSSSGTAASASLDAIANASLEEARAFEDGETRPVTPVLLEPSSETPAPALFEETNDAAETTSPGLMPVPKTGAEAAAQKRGEVEALLASISPFLWSLEGAERWVREHANGDPEGEAYARALALLARVLGQLQARVDEVQKRLR